MEPITVVIGIGLLVAVAKRKKAGAAGKTRGSIPGVTDTGFDTVVMDTGSGAGSESGGSSYAAAYGYGQEYYGGGNATSEAAASQAALAPFITLPPATLPFTPAARTYEKTAPSSSKDTDYFIQPVKTRGVVATRSREPVYNDPYRQTSKDFQKTGYTYEGEIVKSPSSIDTVSHRETPGTTTYSSQTKTETYYDSSGAPPPP